MANLFILQVEIASWANEHRSQKVVIKVIAIVWEKPQDFVRNDNKIIYF